MKPIYSISIIIFLVINFGFSSCKVQKDKDKVKINRQEYMKVSELYIKCNGPCGQATECEGRMAKVMGRIDFKNIFHNESFSHDKFFLKDFNTTAILEVKVESKNNKAIFDKINKAKKVDVFYIYGIVEGFDMSMNGNCMRGITLKVDKLEQLVSY